MDNTIDEESELWKLINAKAIKKNPDHKYPEMTYPAEAVTRIKRNSWVDGYIECMEDMKNPFPNNKTDQNA